jgi:hypothetical protein
MVVLQIYSTKTTPKSENFNTIETKLVVSTIKQVGLLNRAVPEPELLVLVRENIGRKT